MNSKLQFIVNEISKFKEEELSELALYLPKDFLTICSDIRERQMALNYVTNELQIMIDSGNYSFRGTEFNEDVVKDIISDSILLTFVVNSVFDKKIKEREENAKVYGAGKDYLEKFSDWSLDFSLELKSALYKAEEERSYRNR